jgi:hypothetical protein
MPFDTSFNFGANAVRRPAGKKPRKPRGGGKKPKGGGAGGKGGGS